jgi:predicted acyl esterase
LGHALQRVRTPVLLVTGWQDVFLTQTFDQLHGSCATAAPSRS